MSRRKPAATDGLTEKERKIVAAYAANGHNGQEAYRKGAGSKGNDATCKNQFYKLVKHKPTFRAAIEAIEAAAQAAKDAVIERYAVTEANVLEGLARLAFSDMRDVLTWDGRTVGLKSSVDLGDAAAFAVVEVSQTEHGIRIKLGDKRAALVDLGKHLGTFKEETKRFAGEVGGVKFVIEG